MGSTLVVRYVERNDRPVVAELVLILRIDRYLVTWICWQLTHEREQQLTRNPVDELLAQLGAILVLVVDDINKIRIRGSRCLPPSLIVDINPERGLLAAERSTPKFLDT